MKYVIPDDEGFEDDDNEVEGGDEIIDMGAMEGANEEEEDMNDAVVDYNGATNRGYGSMRPVDYFASNHIAYGNFVTEPREYSPIWDWHGIK